MATSGDEIVTKITIDAGAAIAAMSKLKESINDASGATIRQVSAVDAVFDAQKKLATQLDAMAKAYDAVNDATGKGATGMAGLASSVPHLAEAFTRLTTIQTEYKDGNITGTQAIKDFNSALKAVKQGAELAALGSAGAAAELLKMSSNFDETSKKIYSEKTAMEAYSAEVQRMTTLMNKAGTAEEEQIRLLNSLKNAMDPVVVAARAAAEAENLIAQQMLNTKAATARAQEIFDQRMVQAEKAKNEELEKERISLQEKEASNMDRALERVSGEYRIKKQYAQAFSDAELVIANAGGKNTDKQIADARRYVTALNETQASALKSLDKLSNAQDMHNMSRNKMLMLNAAAINSFQALASGMNFTRVAMMEGAQFIGAFAQESTTLTNAVAATINVLKNPLVSAVAAATAAYAGAALIISGYRTELKESTAELRLHGVTADGVAKNLMGLAKAQAQIGGSRGENLTALTSFATNPGMAQAPRASIGAMLPDFAAIATGGDIAKAGKLMESFFGAGIAGIRKLDEAYQLFTPEQAALVEGFYASGRATDAFGVTVDALRVKVEGSAKHMRGAWSELWRDIGIFTENSANKLAEAFGGTAEKSVKIYATEVKELEKLRINWEAAIKAKLKYGSLGDIIIEKQARGAFDDQEAVVDKLTMSKFAVDSANAKQITETNTYRAEHNGLLKEELIAVELITHTNAMYLSSLHGVGAELEANKAQQVAYTAALNAGKSPQLATQLGQETAAKLYREKAIAFDHATDESFKAFEQEVRLADATVKGADAATRSSIAWKARTDAIANYPAAEVEVQTARLTKLYSEEEKVRAGLKKRVEDLTAAQVLETAALQASAGALVAVGAAEKAYTALLDARESVTTAAYAAESSNNAKAAGVKIAADKATKDTLDKAEQAYFNSMVNVIDQLNAAQDAYAASEQQRVVAAVQARATYVAQLKDFATQELSIEKTKVDALAALVASQQQDKAGVTSTLLGISRRGMTSPQLDQSYQVEAANAMTAATAALAKGNVDYAKSEAMRALATADRIKNDQFAMALAQQSARLLAEIASKELSTKTGVITTAAKDAQVALIEQRTKAEQTYAAVVAASTVQQQTNISTLALARAKAQTDSVNAVNTYNAAILAASQSDVNSAATYTAAVKSNADIRLKTITDYNTSVAAAEKVVADAKTKASVAEQAAIKSTNDLLALQNKAIIATGVNYSDTSNTIVKGAASNNAAIETMVGKLQRLEGLLVGSTSAAANLVNELNKVAAVASGTISATAGGVTTSAATNSSASASQAAIVDSFSKIMPKASGGPVSAGNLYQVNENGQEYFQPSNSGSIIPLAPQNYGGNYGGTSITIGGITVNVPLSSSGGAKQIGAEVADQIANVVISRINRESALGNPVIRAGASSRRMSQTMQGG